MYSVNEKKVKMLLHCTTITQHFTTMCKLTLRDKYDTNAALQIFIIIHILFCHLYYGTESSNT